MVQILTPAVAQRSFVDMAVDVSPYLQGCPTAVIARVVKRIVSDLCDRAKVWKGYSEPITLVPETFEYLIPPTVLNATINDVERVRTVVNNTTRDVPYSSLEAVLKQYPQWPDESDGDPQMFITGASNLVWLAPVPDAAGTMTAYVSLRPGPAATSWPEDLYSKHERVIFHGVLHDLMLMPERPWTSDKLALYHGKQWSYLLNDAKASAVRGNNTASIGVAMRPLA